MASQSYCVFVCCVSIMCLERDITCVRVCVCAHTHVFVFVIHTLTFKFFCQCIDLYFDACMFFFLS